MDNRFSEIKSFPTIRAQVGDWFYYLTTLPYYEVARRIKPATDLFQPSNLNQWIQRDIMPRRQAEIAEYLKTQRERFFNSIVVGVHLGEPRWYSINVDANNLFDAPGMDERFEQALGILELSGEEELYAIDGQHRVAGIKFALESMQAAGDQEGYDRLANDDLAMLFVSADTSPEQIQRVRRMFSTLNKRAKAVSTAELIALDEDDAGAIVTRRLAIDYSGLNRVTQVANIRQGLGFVHLGKSNQIPRTNRHSITTIVTLLDVVRSAFAPEVKKLASDYSGNRPPEDAIQQLFDLNVQYWNHLQQCSNALGAVMGSEPGDRLAGQYRRDDGGHILFRPIGQQAFAGAVGVLRSRNVDLSKAIEHLCQVSMEISSPPWAHVLWNPNTNTVINSNRRLAESLLLYMVGHQPRQAGYQLWERYQLLYGDEPAPTGQIPQIPIG